MIANLVLTILVLGAVVTAFKRRQFPRFRSAQLRDTWQEDLDGLLNIDTPWQSRRTLTRDLLGKVRDITTDVADAVRDRDISKVAPKNLAYGKALVGLQDFQQQLVSDIIPDVLTKGVPLLVEEGPKVLQKVTEKGPSAALEKGRKALSAVRELSQDRELRQSTVKDLKRELKNLVRNTPEGLESPYYDVLQQREYYQIRRYAGYSVCTTKMGDTNDSTMSADGDEEDSEGFGFANAETFGNALEMDPLSLSSGFNTLAKYVFGDNTNQDTEESEKLSMTTPVIIDENAMSFVLPSDVTAETAPVPKSDRVELKNVAGGLVAAREFTGITTENEINRQRAKLEDALIEDEVVYDADSFQVLNYNPPFTVPWVRRNEVSFRILTTEDELPRAPPAAMATPSTGVSDDAAVTTETTAATSVSAIETDSSSSSSSADTASATARSGNKRNSKKGSASAKSSSPGFEDDPKDDEDSFFSSPEAGD